MAYGRREPFKCIETGDVFSKKQEAADALNISCSSVHDSLRDGRSHMGYTFVYVSELAAYVDSEITRPEGTWKDISGYEGLYQISDDGRVWSCERIVMRSSGKPNIIRGKLLSAHRGADGYYSVVLADINHKLISYSLHRLVASAFILNPENKPEVNHIDGDKSNNDVSNLEWCTRIENQHHAMINGLTPSGQYFHMKKMSDAALKKNCKPILCVNSNVKYPSRQAAARALHLNANYILNSIRTGKLYKGYLFMEAIDG